MEYVSYALRTVLIISIEVAAGYLFSKAIKLSDAQYDVVAKYTVYVGFPCVIFYNILQNIDLSRFQEDAPYILATLVASIAVFFIAMGFAKLLRLPREKRGLFIVMGALSNILLFGGTISRGIFGEPAMPYVMYTYIINTTLFWTLGNYFIRHSVGKNDKLFSLGMLRRFAKTPMLIAFFSSFVLLLLGVRLPGVVMEAVDALGTSSLPMGMIYIGMTLYRSGISLRMDRGLAGVLGMRFVISPLVMLLLLVPLGAPELPRMVLTLQMAMPVLTQACVVAGLEGADAGYMARGTVLTTLLCLVTTPVITYVASIF